MKTLQLEIKKQEVYDEVAKTTAYIGSKMADDEAYERILTTDENREMLERYWDEAASSAHEQLRRMITTDESEGEGYVVRLTVSECYNDSLTRSVLDALRSFFVYSIADKWLQMADRESAAGYAELAQGAMQDVMSKLWTRMRPRKANGNICICDGREDCC